MSAFRRPANAKYGAKRTELAGRSFASKLEASVYALLLLREKAGEIAEIECQVQVALTAAGIIYKPDFRFIRTADARACFAEAKGFETPEWRIKLRLWKVYGLGPLELWKGSAARPVLVDTINPIGVKEAP